MDEVETKLQEIAQIQAIGANRKSKSYVLDLASHLFANDVILLMSTFNSLGKTKYGSKHANNEAKI